MKIVPTFKLKSMAKANSKIIQRMQTTNCTKRKAMEFPLCKEAQMHEVTQFNTTRKTIKIW